MAGIGEATAIAATIQIGFSLARTLIAVVGDYKSAREDISSIATEVDATLNQAAELDALVKNNVHTRRLNDRGLKLAEKCRVDSTRIVEKLIGLLTKTRTAPEDQPYTIGPEDIEVSKFGRAAWIFLKPQIVVIQRELNSVRLQILLAHTCIDAESAPNAKDRAAASKLIPGLQRSRQLARRLVREAQVESDKAEQSALSNRGIDLQSAPVTSGISSPPLPRGSRAMNRTRNGTSRLSGRTDVAAQSPVLYSAMLDDNDTDRVADEIRRELEQELLANLESKVKEQDAIKAYDKRVRDEAVEGYKQGTRERLSTMKERTAETRRQLQAAFTSELPDTEVQKFLDAQHQKELDDDFVELMIDAYKAPPLESRPVQDVDTLSQHTESSRVSTKSWLSKILPTKSRRSNSMYFGSVHSKEDLAPIFETQYIHLQVVSHHDRPSLLPLDNSTFSHIPCNSVCDAQRTSTIWASLSPLCEALILDYLSRNCQVPPPAKWQLHSAWPVTQQLSRRGRYLQRALLGSQLLSWQGNFIVVFSALCARPHSQGSPAEVVMGVRPLKLTAKDDQKAIEPSVVEPEPAKPQPVQQQPKRAAISASPIDPTSQQPEPTSRNEVATLPVKLSPPPQIVAPGQAPPQQYNGSVPPSGPYGSFSDHPPGQLVHKPSSMYQYGSMPYAPPFPPSAAPSAQTLGSLGSMYPSSFGYPPPSVGYPPPSVGYPPPGGLVPFTSPNPFTPYDQPPYGHPPMGMPYPPISTYGDAPAPPFDPGAPYPYPGVMPPYPTAANAQLPSPVHHPPPPPADPDSPKNKPRTQRKSASSSSQRDRRLTSKNDTSSSSSSGPESIYPLRSTTASRSRSRRLESIQPYPDSSIGRKSAVTFSNPPAAPSPPTRTASSTTRKPSSLHVDNAKSYHDVYSDLPVVRSRDTDRANKRVSPDDVVASDDDVFDDMVENYMGSGRPADESDDDSDESWASVSVDTPAAAQHDSDSSSAPEQRFTLKRSATVEEMSSEEEA